MVVYPFFCVAAQATRFTWDYYYMVLARGLGKLNNPIIITWSLTSKLQMDRGQAALHGIILTWSLTRKLTDRPGHANHVKKKRV